LKEAGVDEVIIYCVNDGAVMMAWAENQGVKDDDIVTLMGDPFGELTAALDMEMTHEGPVSVGIFNRCKRFALYVENGVVKIVRLAEAFDDPAGDDRPEVTLADSMVDAIKALKGSDEL
jgi:2-Cys peroxiredoxin 5